jgi:hypothetical protein
MIHHYMLKPAQDPTEFGEQEYVRKGALIEWAKQKQYDSLTIVADNFWQEVIDYLNSL